MDQIQGFLENLKQGGKQTHLNLTVIPLLSSETADPDYVTLDEALSQGAVEITEVSQSGHVPELKLINQSANNVLVVDGEELVGAKQNRIVNASFLIAGNSEVIIPVSCVEQGRWSYRSRKFASGEKVMPAMLRVEHQRDVAFSLSRGEGYHSDQGKIWDGIHRKCCRMGVRSSTGAMADLFEGQRDRLSEYQKPFSLGECQVGSIFALNGDVVGLECFGHSRIFEKFFKKLIRSYALDALDWLDESKSDHVPAESIRNFLGGIDETQQNVFPSLGLGENIRFQGKAISGAALCYEGNILHMCAFSMNNSNENSDKIKYQRFSQRRKRQ